MNGQTVYTLTEPFLGIIIAVSINTIAIFPDFIQNLENIVFLVLNGCAKKKKKQFSCFFLQSRQTAQSITANNCITHLHILHTG